MSIKQSIFNFGNKTVFQSFAGFILVFLLFASAWADNIPGDNSFEEPLPFEETPFPEPFLNEECTATALNRSFQVNPNGTFSTPNLPPPLGQFRIRVVCERLGVIRLGRSELLTLIHGGTIAVGPITFGDSAPIPVLVCKPADGISKDWVDHLQI